MELLIWNGMFDLNVFSYVWCANAIVHVCSMRYVYCAVSACKMFEPIVNAINQLLIVMGTRKPV